MHDETLYKWYSEAREEYLKDYLEKSDRRNKFILTGSGGGILTSLKFIELYPDNNYFQSEIWILLGLFFGLALTTLFSYIYGAKSSEEFMVLITDIYSKCSEDENKCLTEEVKNLETKNKSFKRFKKIDKVIEKLVILIAIFVSFIIIGTVIFINKPKGEKNIMNKQIKKVILNGRKPKPSSTPINDSFIPKAPPISKKS